MASKKETLKPRIESMTLLNTTRRMVPVQLNRSGKLVQVNIGPRQSIQILPSEVTDTVVNLTSGTNKVLVLK